MIYRKLGKSEIEASVIALGTWVMGGWMWGGADEKESIAAIEASIDHGVNLIDTAPVYGFGASEEIIGKAISGKREKVILATKCGLVWERKIGDFFFFSNKDIVSDANSDFEVYKYLGPESIRKELEDSLRRLSTDYIDLYQTHWQESTTPIEDTMAELTKLKDEGKIRAIGVSNATPEQMKEYGAIATDQEKFSMLQRDIVKKGNTDYCCENNIAVLAYSPLTQGLLSGKIKPDYSFNDGDARKNKPLFQGENLAKVNSMLNDMKELADSNGLTYAQLILRWTFAQRGITHLLCGARNEKQAIENAFAGEMELSEETIGIMDSIFSKHFGD